MNRDFYLGTKDALMKVRIFCRKKGIEARELGKPEAEGAFDEIIILTLRLWQEALDELGGKHE